MNKTLPIVFLLIFLIFPAALPARTFRQLGIKEGFSSRQVFRINKDSAGFIWAFTHLGVDRYDGNEVKHYELDKTLEAKDYILSSSTMTCDRTGNIWISLRNGKIYSYNKQTDRFVLQIDLIVTLSDPFLFLNDMLFDDDNQLWLSLSSGLYHFDPQTKEVKAAGLVNEYINRLIQLEDGSFVAGTNTHLYQLWKDKETGTFSPESLIRFPWEIKTESLFSYGGILFIGTFSDGAYRVNLPTGKVTSFHGFIPSVPIRAFAMLSDQTLLVGTDGAGMYRIRLSDGTLMERFVANEDEEGSLNGNTVSDILVDERDCIWVSTYTNGIGYLNPDYPQIHWIKHGRHNPHSLISSHVNVILEDSDGDLWYGTNNGVSLYQPASNKWTHFLNKDESNSVSSGVILALCEDTRKNVWVGGYGTGVYSIDKRTGNVRKAKARTYPDPTGIATDYIYSIHCDGDELYFGGIEGELTCYNLRTNTYAYYPVTCVGDIRAGAYNKLLLAECGGLVVFDKITKEIDRYNQLGDFVFQYPVRCLLESSTGEIWMASDGNGLLCYDPATKQLRPYTSLHGIESNSINNVVEDSSGQIWFNTEKNLYCLDPETGKIVSMNEFLDIDWGHYNPNASIRLRNGDLALGTADGVVVFSPDFKYEETEDIQLIFTDFKLLYQSVEAGKEGSLLKQAINETPAVRLKYVQNSFSLSFSSIGFVYPHRIRYEYMLEDFNKEWQHTDTTRDIDYMNLPAGKYTFRLKAVDKYSNEVITERSLAVVIGRPFWATYRALLFYLTIVGMIGYLSVQFVKHRIKEYNSREKIRSFISVAHDIRTPITLIKAPLSELRIHDGLSDDQRKSLDIASKNAEKLFEMVTQLLDLQKADLHPDKLTLSPQHIYTYLQDILTDFRMAAIQKGVDIQLTVQPGFPEVWFDKGKMNKILDNLLSNALKYTEKGSILVNATYQRQLWSIEIRDTGIGIPEKERKNLFQQFYRAENAINSSETGSGIGLVLVKKMVKQLDGKITFSSTQHAGSSFTITFPLKADSAGINEPEIRKETVPATDTTRGAEDSPAPAKNVLLLAEDDIDMREYLTENLSKEYEVVSVTDGKQALKMAKDINPDIIISDVIMPGLEGDEMCRILKSSMETSHIPIILLTALSERENIISGLEAGANDYIIKPFDFSVLKVRIRNILQSRQHLRETVLSPESSPEEVDYTSRLDKEFLDRTLEIINQQLSNPEFSINDFCRMLGMSRTSVYNKLKTLTDQSPNDFIRIIRLNRSKELLISRKYTIGEVSYMVGFSDPKYFSTCFKKQFGISPSKV
ncbi:MAG: response regulator [Bacteroides sp.]|nr:response regulator [Bacteroides sp.]